VQYRESLGLYTVALINKLISHHEDTQTCFLSHCSRSTSTDCLPVSQDQRFVSWYPHLEPRLMRHVSS